MELHVSFTRESIDEVLRKWHQWPVLLMRYTYSALIFIALTLAAIRSTYQQVYALTPNWRQPALLWLVCCGIAAYIVWAYRRAVLAQTDVIRRLGQLRLVLSSQGIETLQENGAKNFEPWKTYSRFRAGKRVVVLFGAKNSHRLIPMENLPDADRQQLIGFLASCLS